MEEKAADNNADVRPDVLFVMPTLQVGGTERQVALLADTLRRRGMRIAVYSFADGAVRGQIERSGVTVILSPLSPATLVGLLSTAVHLFWFLLTRRPCIVQFFLPAAYLVGAPAAILTGIPIRVMSRRSLNSYQRSRLIRWLEKGLHRRMQAVLGNSRCVVAQLRQEGVPAKRLGLIYNGIEAAQFSNRAARGACRAELGVPVDAVALCIVANLIPYKGHADLIDALALAAAELPRDWRLLVIGRDDGIGLRLREQAKRLGLEPHIIFLGAQDDVAPFLAASDIGILCSHQEGLSNAVLEGMAAGLPMIVSAVGGNPEIVVDEESGLVVPARDAKGLADAIVRLANNPALCARFGAAGRQRVKKHFTVVAFAERHQALYDALRSGRLPDTVREIALAG